MLLIRRKFREKFAWNFLNTTDRPIPPSKFHQPIPPRSLTVRPWKKGGWKTIFLLGRQLFRGYVKLRGGISLKLYEISLTKPPFGGQSVGSWGRELIIWPDYCFTVFETLFFRTLCVLNPRILRGQRFMLHGFCYYAFSTSMILWCKSKIESLCGPRHFTMSKSLNPHKTATPPINKALLRDY